VVNRLTTSQNVAGLEIVYDSGEYERERRGTCTGNSFCHHVPANIGVRVGPVLAFVFAFALSL
jgi:hypothetical protein